MTVRNVPQISFIAAQVLGSKETTTIVTRGETNHFNTSTVKRVIQDVMQYNPVTSIVIKSTVPVGYTAKTRDALNCPQSIFSSEFLRESKAL
jgi:UDP-glucose 6-dehydrogenase